MNPCLLRLLIALPVALILAQQPAAAQLRATQFVTGLTNPVEFVQDPTDPTIQFVLEQGGRVRAIRNGVLQAGDFLNLMSVISSGGERGLLGMAFPPDHQATSRFFLKFTNPDGDTVVARFRRTGPVTADPASRFDLRWPDGRSFVDQPFANHNGGHLAFGPDGFLYIGMGDGGSGNDPDHNAQNPATLLGKMLRIDVSVPDGDPEGYNVPPDNPFTAPGYLREIWAFGLRNPWKYSFDDPALGGTGALVIADVGQNAWEEIDYEPAGTGGRNYGWRNREGAHDNITSEPPAFLPLTDPVFELGRASARSITGGYVYRGTALGATYRGRYFFADFVTKRVWSIVIGPDNTGTVVARDLLEHTAELGGSDTLGFISSFGVDAGGELYVLSHSRGIVFRIEALARPALAVDTPGPGARLTTPFAIAGWAIDTAAPDGTGVDAVHVWSYPNPGSTEPAVFVGAAAYGGDRPDVGAAFGDRFTNSGFNLIANDLQPGSHRLVIFARSTVSGAFFAGRTVDIAIAGRPHVAIDTPGNAQPATQPFLLAGWSADLGAPAGTGVDALHVWAYPNPDSGEPPSFIGAAPYGHSRPDVAAAFGAQFEPSGYGLTVRGLRSGTYRFVAFARSSITGAFAGVRSVDVRVARQPAMSMDVPSGTTPVASSFQLAGWAIDVAAAEGTGVDAVHAWAFPASGGPAVFLGSAAYGGNRPDVAAGFGAAFQFSGYNLVVQGLAPGTYLIASYARSTIEGIFDQSRAVVVTVR